VIGPQNELKRALPKGCECLLVKTIGGGTWGRKRGRGTVGGARGKEARKKKTTAKWQGKFTAAEGGGTIHSKPIGEGPEGKKGLRGKPERGKHEAHRGRRREASASSASSAPQ